MPTPSSGRAGARLVSAALILLAMVVSLVGPAPARVLAVSPNLVISQVYGGGGNSGASYSHDFVELFNRGSSAVSLGSLSIQYASAAGTGNFGASNTQLTELPNVTLQPGQYYLIQQASNAAVGSPLPTPDLVDPTPIAMAVGAGKVALVTGTSSLACNGGSAPCSAAQLARIIDLVGYGNANFFEGAAAAPTLTSSTAAFRAAGGCTDTDNNSADFSSDTPAPRNTASPLNPCGGDAAPSVTAVDPADGATGVPAGTNISVTFSEPVSAPAGAFGLSCGGNAVAFALSGGPTTFTLDPAADLPSGATCTLTIDNTQVSDQDTDDPPDTMAAAFSSSFTVVASPTTVRIHQIQGSGPAVTGPGPFTVEAIVVGDYQTQGAGQLRGFFLQEEDADADADPATSEGIFVFCSGCPVDVSVGDKVRVTGAASEFFGMSQLTADTAGSVSVLSSGNELPTPASLALPVPGVPSGDLAAATAAINAYYEQFEGMLVTFPATLSVSEYFELARYGQVILTEGGRPHTFTAVNTPSAAGLIDHQIDLARRKVILDDADNRQNRPVDTPNTPYYHPVPGLSTENYFRGGDTITDLTGVLHWSFAGQAGTDAWRIRPVTEAFEYKFSPVNPRPDRPEVPGRLQVASFNVLNYFLTVDTTASNDVGTCGPSGTQDCRGADSAQELQRQRDKLTKALLGLDADVLGLMEMENTPGVTPSLQIVEDLNQALGADIYAYINTGVIGTDAIRLGIIYKQTTVSPVGDHAILDSSVDPRFVDTRNRPALAQSFEELGTGARFTVVVNHLKSKGSGCGAGDDDTTTGQGNCNGTRTLAAQALADWLMTDPTGSGDPDVLIIGDLNAYAKEDPIVALQSAGYTDLVAKFGGPGAYGYVFDGQLGYLDHALSNPSLTPQVAGVAEWHINADEIPLFDYNDDVRDAGEAAFEKESDSLPLYEKNAFRTSDHDPVIIGLDLNVAPTVDAGGPYSVVEGGSVTLSATASDDTYATSLQYAWDLDNDGTFETAGQSVTFSAAGIEAPATRTVAVRVTDELGLSATATTSVNVVYNFSGFFAPIANLPVVNTVNAGRAIPVKFSLGGDQGLAIFKPDYPQARGIACDGSPSDEVDVTVSAGGSSLQYDPATDTYTYVWKTERTWAGSCRQLVVKLNDGTEHVANFRFR
ncbi:MAG TPA: ExeM/NucH family extracellular endonuclease [Chloroflexaceae bacterium]|nr:ExeM/NucH family extracellular endonuclease [Chloroflexaceae bacterium]